MLTLKEGHPLHDVRRTASMLRPSATHPRSCVHILRGSTKLGAESQRCQAITSHLACSTTTYFQKKIVHQTARKKLEPYYPNAPRNRPKETVQTISYQDVL